jgi:hypothetical protein
VGGEALRGFGGALGPAETKARGVSSLYPSGPRRQATGDHASYTRRHGHTSAWTREKGGARLWTKRYPIAMAISILVAYYASYLTSEAENMRLLAQQSFFSTHVLFPSFEAKVNLPMTRWTTEPVDCRNQG